MTALRQILQRSSRPGALLKIALSLVGALFALLLLAALVVPADLLRGFIQNRLTASIGRRVTISRLDITNRLSLAPTLSLMDVDIAQPGWAGPGPMVHVPRASIRLRLLPALFGSVQPELIVLDRPVVRLRRDASGRDNWSTGSSPSRRGGIAPVPLIITGGTLDVVDQGRGMAFHGPLVADRQGLHAQGLGSHRGQPLRVRFDAAPLASSTASSGYPFSLALTSPLVQLRARGQMTRALAFSHFTSSMEIGARGALALDDLIQVGLPDTQPLKLSGQVKHDGGDWTVSALRGIVGHSSFQGDLHVGHAARVSLSARVHASRFDFDDLSSTAAMARSAELTRRIGKRLIPNTQIHLEHLANLDGVLQFRADRLWTTPGSPFRSLEATVRLDHRQLHVAPLQAGLVHGTVHGHADVDGRGAVPLLRLDLSLTDARTADIFGGRAYLDGPLRGRFLLSGRGTTIRTALAHASGRVDFVGNGGSMTRRLATFASGDLIRSLGQLVDSSKADRVPIRCLIARFDARDGKLSPSPLVLDTAIARVDGRGTVTLTDERLDLSLDGATKRSAPIQAHPSISVTGTLARPQLNLVDPQHAHGLFGKIGDLLGRVRIGSSGHPAPDAPCAQMIAAIPS